MFEGATKKQKTKLLGSLITMALLGVLAIVVLIAYLNKSFSWFSSNLEVSATGMNVSVEGIDAEAEYKVYIFDAKLNDVRYSDDGRTPVGSDPTLENLKMQVHDVVFKSRNRYTPAVVHIHLFNISESYRQNGSVSLTLVRNNDAAYETGTGGKKVLPKKTTSILRFTLANNMGTSWISADNAKTEAQNATLTYNNVDNALYQKIVLNGDYTDIQGTLDLDSKVFTTYTLNAEDEIETISKASSITLTVSCTSDQVASGELDLFLYITYDQDLVDVFVDSGTIGTGGTTIGQISTLLNDLTDLIISFD